MVYSLSSTMPRKQQAIKKYLLESKTRSGIVVHIYNPSFLRDGNQRDYGLRTV
jgi:hypothetical protein